MTLVVGSLFAGIGGFDLGFEHEGMRVEWQVENDAACQRVLRKRFPGTALHDDVRAVGASNLEPVDIICGGFPCQDLSIAGKRAGLAGERSGLFYEMTRIVDELQPALLVWENVPGLFSAHEGRDFAHILVELARIGYVGGWTTLDAQWFGVAQRRRRVFGVFARGDIGAAPCEQILALSHRMRGNFAPGGKAGEAVAGTLGGGAGKRGWCDDLDRAGAFVASPLTGNAYADRAAEENNLIANALNAKSTGRYDATVETMVVHPLTAEGCDASEDGTGRGVPLVAFPANMSGTQCASAVNISPSIQAENPTAVMTLALRGRGDGLNLEIRQDGIANTVLTPSGGRGGIGVGAICAPQMSGAISASLGSGGYAPDKMHNYVAGTLPADYGKQGGNGFANIPGAMIGAQHGVRRLTPLECERLQGFPDGWTATGIDERGREVEISDSARYHMLGNAVCVKVSRWLGGRIALVMGGLR